MSAAVLILAYKRAEVLKRTLSSLEAAEPVNVSEFHIVLQGADVDVKNILSSIPWKHNLIHTEYPQDISTKEAINRNLFIGLSTAFENKEIDYVVVLEDDICISKDFFEFVFAVYSQNFSHPSFRAVNGFSGIPREHSEPGDYGLYRFGVGWGWALPRSTWEKLRSIWKGDEDQHWDGLIESFIKTGYVAAPGMSRVLNIGFGEGATHTNAFNDPEAGRTKRKIEASFFDPTIRSGAPEFRYKSTNLMWREDCRNYVPETDVRGRVIQLLYRLMHRTYRIGCLLPPIRPVTTKITALLRGVTFKID